MEEGAETSILDGIPEKFTAFHWHGDTFSLPEGSKRLFSSEVCENQGFAYREKVIGLQFHLEMSNKTIGNVIENCKDELIEGKYIQNEEMMLNKNILLAETKMLMFRFMDNFKMVITNM